jgi:hypothetical protein
LATAVLDLEDDATAGTGVQDCRGRRQARSVQLTGVVLDDHEATATLGHDHRIVTADEMPVPRAPDVHLHTGGAGGQRRANRSRRVLRTGRTATAVPENLHPTILTRCGDGRRASRTLDPPVPDVSWLTIMPFDGV